MRYLILFMVILIGPAISSQAQAQSQLSISIGNRGVSLGFVMSTYPTLVRIPGYPVYYDPRVDANYFFYDGLYWVFWDDNWYSSTWYDGPWDLVPPAYVPLFVLRVPVRYYRRPPVYFRGWRYDAAPRWGDHWGRDWERQRSGWDRWDRRSVPRAAPLPAYQRHYSGNRYPRQLDQQRSIESRSYRYRPRESVSRQILDQRRRGAESHGRQQQRQQQDDRQQRQQQDDRQQQQQLRGRQQQDVQQRQERNARQQQDVRQQQQLRGRQQQDVQLQQQQKARQQQSVEQQQQLRGRQQQDVQRQQQRRAQQQRSQPARNARGADNKDRKGRTDKDKDKGQKDDHRDGSGHP
ncbi:hypothetical protein ACFPPA_10820 [Rhodanobacter ginsengisoli]|uniref:Uncharacterized protein n=1 Tax=Rhodanobacter ginsengisoli TaxID=418646 RepID=A0ABW0QPP4_9GAMM